MHEILKSYFGFIGCDFTYSQDSRLFENYWYLTNVIENGIDHPPVISATGLSFDLESSMMTAQGCLNMMATVTFENDTDFSVSNFQYCLCWCNDAIADAYDGLYFGFFSGTEFDDSTINNFTYTISESDDVRTLIINSISGTQAIYSNYAVDNRSQYSGFQYFSQSRLGLY